jgi:hypothetical protein|tara:strand:+ start:538 stop:789 length:252 start_codon:yes stop_codon:yes gene_type:complete
MKKHIINCETGEEVIQDFTTEEVTQTNEDKAQLEAEQLAFTNAKTQKDADAKAGNDKLIALGLSQDEVTAMTGYSIPVVSEEE